jgi:hypothetical protein
MAEVEVCAQGATMHKDVRWKTRFPSTRRIEKGRSMQNGHRRMEWLRVLAFVLPFLWASSLEAQSPLGPAFLVNPPSAGNQDQPDLHFDGDGNLWLVWVDSVGIAGQDAEFDRLKTRAVSPQGDQGPVLTLADTSDIPLTPVVSPVILPRRDGSLEAFYIRYNKDGFALAYGQRFTEEGDPSAARFLISPAPPSSTGSTAVAALPNGGVFLANLSALCEVCSKWKISL